MNKGVILGIDFSADYTQFAYLNENNEPVSIEVMGIKENFLMPSAMFYNTELKEWAAGEEAINRNRVEEGIIIENIPLQISKSQGANILEENIEWKEIVSKFFEAVIKIAINCLNGALIRNIVISVDDPDEKIMQVIYEAMKKLGYPSGSVKIINHAESFAYYVLNQGKDIWINNVLLVDFNEGSPLIRKMFVSKGRAPFVADVQKKDISDEIAFRMLEHEVSSRKADEAICRILKEELTENVVSAVFLTGQGFMKEGWYEKTIELICKNRRVFAGNNLIVKGCAYAAKEIYHNRGLGEYIISCKGRTKVNVAMNVVNRGMDTKVMLSRTGSHWYEAGSKTQCILDNAEEAEFIIQSPATREVETIKISLADFPKRSNKTVRVEVSLAYTDENKFVIEIKDLGFGEFYDSSETIVRYEYKIQ